MSYANISSYRVRKLLRRFHKQFKPYRVKLVEQYGEDSALGITQQTLKEYTLLLPQTPQFKGRFNLFNWVIVLNALIVALFKAMKADGKSPEETAKLLYEVSEESHRSMPSLVRWVGSKAFFSRFFLKFAQRSANQVRDHPQGWKIDYRRSDTHGCDWSFECSECGVIKYFHQHGADDLAPYCNYVDFIQSRAFGLGMENPQNIGQGDGVCRELFKKGRETRVPANLKSIVIPVRRANRKGK